MRLDSRSVLCKLQENVDTFMEENRSTIDSTFAEIIEQYTHQLSMQNKTNVLALSELKQSIETSLKTNLCEVSALSLNITCMN